MGSWNRRNQCGGSGDNDNYKDLLVFGYSSTVFPNDYTSEHIAEERHMVPCLGDPDNRVDSIRGSREAIQKTNVFGEVEEPELLICKRYDCRLLLPSIDVALKRKTPTDQCPTEALEEDMCDEERYMDMHKDVQKRKYEEERKRKEEKSAIGFDYGTGPPRTAKSESDSEDEPFEAPAGIKFPVGLELPPNMKLHHIIEKTASFVVANGAQMEIVIKAKQRNNAEQFGFLEFDHILNPFYKYLQKLIREKKYIPDITKRPKKLTKTVSSVVPGTKNVLSSSLAAIAAAHGSDSDDSDSDCELHPSLLSGSVKHPLTPEKPGTIGPRKKPVEEEKEDSPEVKLKPAGDISQRNDVYAALFKNISHVTRQATGAEDVEVEKPVSMNSNNVEHNDPEGRSDDPDYRDWYECFYGRPCPWIGPRPMLPPTPDLEPILNSYAEHVALKGAGFEESLAARADLQLHFMDPKSPYYSFYHHKIRTHQWRLTQEYASFPPMVGSPAPAPLMSAELLPPTPMSTVSSPGTSSLMNISISTPETPLNRRQRRRLLETSRIEGSITEPGVIDPITMLTKSPSAPANMPSLETPKPVSFSLKVDEHKNHEDSSFRFDPDVDDIEAASTSQSICGIPPPPTPPVLSNVTQTQIDRKEKARIFMEKLLNEKKAKKQQEDEERVKLEEETRRKAEKISESLYERKTMQERGTPRSLDDMINSRINSLLSESGFNPVEQSNKPVEKEDAERNRKKHRKRSRSRRRSRSRGSRDRSEDRKKSRKSERRRSRSSSRDRRRRRNRSRSSERSYRR